MNLSADGSRGVIERCVREFAETARRLESPPERVLALFKDMVFHLPGAGTASASHIDDSRASMASLVQIVIDAYYYGCGGTGARDD
jgi:hypothetical protein